MVNMNNKINFFALAALAITLLCPMSGHTATSANINLSGTVAVNISVSSSAASYDFGDPSVDTVADAAVASLTVNSNAAAGYTLNLTNANAGFFLDDGSGNTIAYTLKYDGVALTYGATVQLETDNGAGGSTVNSSKPLTASLTPSSTLPAGTYTDQLTVSIIAN
jgi:spore coat protein U-like protein